MEALLLLILTTLSVATSTVYNITSADTIKHDTAGYFVSNTQLYFLPGLHHLHTNLIIQNVSNIALIGTMAYGTVPETTIQCTSSVGIVMLNISNLVIKNLIFKNCEIQQHEKQAAIFIEECSFVQLNFIRIYHDEQVISLLGINILGDSYLQDITCFSIYLYYNETATKAKDHNIMVNRYNIINRVRGKYGIYLKMSQYSYKIIFHIMNTIIQKLNRSAAFLYVISNNSAISNTVFVTNCKFINNSYFDTKNFFYSVNVSVHFNCSQIIYNKYLNCEEFISIIHSGNVGIFNCDFSYNTPIKSMKIIGLKNISNIEIKHCNFHGNNVIVLVISKSIILIQNTTFSTINIPLRLLRIFSTGVIFLTNSRLLLKGPVIFHKNRIHIKSIILASNSSITVNGYIEFSRNYASSIIDYYYSSSVIIKVQDNTTILIIHNEIFKYFTTDIHMVGRNLLDTKYTHPQCFFQYFCDKNLDNYIHFGKFSITIENNVYKNLSFEYIFLYYYDRYMGIENTTYHTIMLALTMETTIKITHCYWLPYSAFRTAIPLDVNRQYIQYKNNSEFLQFGGIEKTLCYCNDEENFDCFKDELSPLYPGQTLKASFYTNVNSSEPMTIIAADIQEILATPCKVINAKEHMQITNKNCTKVKYTISFPTNNWCELFLKTSRTPDDYDIFYIRELSCPLGFAKIDGICQCYPSFKQFGFADHCDINTQTILRPSRGWISLDVYAQQNNSFSCYISQQCPSDYCKPYSFYVNLSTPDSQCQFNRIGFLCGQCQQGLSTIFGSSRCQHCSNIYLLLIIPIAIAGLALVFLLFNLNLTVTDGTINPFILYVNIIGINSTMFFPDHHTITDPIRIFISFANLDLGITTCFYNGMDDYSKVWLQLAFPFYIISVTLLIIIVSRYSITIQRLTTHRTIPVLATLFLLSYTNILQTTSNVLFFYSSIAHLPSEHTTLVWSVDANIRLFGIKFTLLFVVCLLLFIILLLFTGLTLCPKRILKFKIFNNLKSFSGSCQRPYKIYYWFGLQLVMRIIFYYVSLLVVKHHFIIISVFLNVVNGFQGMWRPFKNKLNNYQELFLMINLLVLYVFLLSEQWIGIYTLISLAEVHLSLIIVCRIMTPFCSRLTARIPCCWRTNINFTNLQHYFKL